ncbi:MAG: hypothetical protein JNM17_30900 [Archangium sp.]|nr:hypothetical protein [Archangium sp.]
MRSARVSFGEFGVIHAVVLQVVPHYRIEESRILTTWEHERDTIVRLSEDPSLRHIELWINPYPNIFNGDHSAILVKRKQVDSNAPLNDAGFEDPAAPIAADKIWQKNLTWMAYNLAPEIVGAVLGGNLAKLPLTGRVQEPNDIFDIGKANEIPAVSGEYIFKASQAELAVDTYLAHLHANAMRWLQHPGWVSLRFVNGTTSRMSMFNSSQGAKEKFCSIELPMVTGGTATWLPQIRQSIEGYQAVCRSAALNGRMHWAQSWKLSDAEKPAFLTSHYPEWKKWRSHQQQIGGATFAQDAFLA